MEDLDQRRVAIQKLQLVRRFANQDREPCAVLPGLFIGIDFTSAVIRFATEYISFSTVLCPRR